ncbi:Fur family transcriptional regulator [Nocardioides sp.]|jgi:Fur family ferric uptake transcriptional regulator|uniref:Fur family transcriptional regulator n=1 Tax=Nocardioides sp. TaxID=35761 RepID=UPI0031FECDED|nr:transcriptional repressor [Nocardioides sp.]
MTHEHAHDAPAPTSGGDLREALRKRGFRMTAQRELILVAIDKLGHSTAEELLVEVRQSVSAVNLSTVYRTLDMLEEVGLVRHIHLAGRAPTYHSTTGPQHFHLTCRNCGAVFSVDEDVASGFAQRLRAEEAFVADIGHLTVFGTCLPCSQGGDDL